MATAKTKKVQTPIDERETFVSLQKSFAETEQSVEEKLKVLYELQQADNELDKLVQLRGELPSEVEALQAEVATLKGKIERVGEVIASFNASIEDAKQDIVDRDADIDKYQKQLENISNSREYDSINKELENLNLERAIAEKKIRESRERIEECKNDAEIISEHLAIREQDLEAKNEELANIVESTAKEEATLQARRDACAAKIDERTMSAYNRIRASVHNHLAVVAVYNGNACGGCFNTIIPQRLVEIASNKKLIICEHCGRILVNPDFSE